ncbi:MAG: heat shock protein HspQ, partial [Candidatus Omnitrophica bacterium]|nr:heat shock protein HspQ [Candidatus Omnitrophota bacterium]
KKKGIPISLASVYMLVGKRLGLQIEGCHFPGHFLAKIRVNGRNVFIDCFNGGQVIERGDILSGRQDITEGIDEILNENVIPETIIRRYLANLIRAFQLKNDMQNVRLMTYFFDSIDYWVNRESIRNFSPNKINKKKKGRFHAGQVVRHKSYGYRGIVVASDQFCMASDEWYYGNQTQPDRNQPWLHVFVDGSDQVTYVAESNLIEDSDKKKIEHPLLSYFFTEDKAKGYVRNSNNWPETDF